VPFPDPVLLHLHCIDIYNLPLEFPRPSSLFRLASIGLAHPFNSRADKTDIVGGESEKKRERERAPSTHSFIRRTLFVATAHKPRHLATHISRLHLQYYLQYRSCPTLSRVESGTSAFWSRYLPPLALFNFSISSRWTRTGLPAHHYSRSKLFASTRWRDSLHRPRGEPLNDTSCHPL
jgi:hypothetical protein